MVKKFMDLPISGRGCLWATFTHAECDATIEFKYHDQQTGKPCIGSLIFPTTLSFRFRDEPHSLGFPSESYDSVAEVFDSQWIAEFERIEPAQTPRLGRRRHFAVFLSSCGLFEVIADDCGFSSRSE
jgi:hypothetical protein